MYRHELLRPPINMSCDTIGQRAFIICQTNKMFSDNLLNHLIADEI